MGIVHNTKEVLIGLVLLLVVAGFAAKTALDANITGTTKFIVLSLTIFVGLGLLFAALKGLGGEK